MKFLFRMLLLILFSAFHANAAPTCRQVFEQSLDPMKYVNVARLSKAGFSISKGEDGLIYLVDVKTNVTISNLKVLDVPYLYEWASKEEHEAWFQNNGVSTADMKYILSSPGQSYGKGYYVSTSYWDSSSFGSALTVFKPTRPLVILDYKMSSTEKLDTDTVFRLRRGGIDGLAGDNTGRTWLSIINEKQLSTTSEPIRDAQLDELPREGNSPDLVAIKISTSELWDQISDTSKLKNNYRDTYDLNKVPILFKAGVNYVPKQRAFLEKLSQEFVLDYGDFYTLTTYFNELTKQLIPRKKNTPPKFQSLNSATDFMDLVKLRTRSNVKVRDCGALATDKKGQTKVFKLDVKSWTASSNLYRKNNLVKISPVDDENPSAGVQVEYLSLNTILERQIFKLFPPELLAKFNTMQETNRFSQIRNTTEEKFIYQESIQALLEILMKPESDTAKSLVHIMATSRSVGESDVENYYQAFLSVHPFEKNNDLAAKLYFEWVTGKMSGNSLSIDPINADAPLFIWSVKLKPYLAATEFFNAWIALSTDPAQAEIRRQMAVEFLANTFTGKIEVVK